MSEVKLELINEVQKYIKQLIVDNGQHEKQISYMRYYDELTDLPNFLNFGQVLQQALGEAKNTNEKLAVYFIDLNYFREINDVMGYTFGDKLLKACGTKLKSFLQTDTFIARMAGDEFLILKRDISDNNETTSFAERLITAFKQPILIEDHAIYTSISIGISMFPNHGQTADDLIKQAGAAMYVIKKAQQQNYRLYDRSISENAESIVALERDLRKAIKEEQFELHYQPQKNLETGNVVGMEALLRWQHPTRGNIPPLDFIPLAEKTGLIIEIGDWVMQEACRQNKEWQDQGYKPIIVSVNLSAKQFQQIALIDKIETILRETGLAPEYLELEITESIALTNEQHILAAMNRLRELGVLVSIDDFGTGYSSLKYLSLFPVTKLKIDKMFMDEKTKHNQAIVKSIIRMSHSLNMKVIAEGVETIDQVTFLEHEKCDEMQGYYFCKPLPSSQLPKIFAMT